jgi:hypothetical protein
MDHGGVSPGPAGTAAHTHDADATQEDQGTLGQAQEKAQEAAGQAQEKAREAADRAQEGIRQQIDQRSTEAGERVAGTAGDLRSVGEELRKQGKEGPAKLADRAAEQTERVGSYLKDADADRLLSEVEDFGRRRPWAVLAGGLVVGVAAARFLKASSRDRFHERTAHEQRTRELSPPVAAPAPVTPRYPAQPLGTPPPTQDPAVAPPDPVVGP